MGFSVCVPTYVCFIFRVDFAIQIKVYRKILFYDLSKYTHSQPHWAYIHNLFVLSIFVLGAGDFA